MRIRKALVLLVAVLGACSWEQPAAVPSATPMPNPSAAPTNLAAADPAAPTLHAFRREATRACATARAQVETAALRGDPLRAGVRQRDIRAAIGHFRAAATAWTQAAGRLWEFGLPDRRAAQKLITALDTWAQYSQQTADFLQSGERASAQAALGAADAARRDVNRIARLIGMPAVEECGRTPPTLRNPRREPVTAADFTFGVGAVGPGPTRFVLRNDGDEDHQLTIIRLRSPGTVDDAVRQDRADGNPARFLRGVPRTSRVVGAGQRGRLDVRLRPGPYALVCFVASPDGTPHAYKGMATEIFVEGPPPSG